jgi:hypothetical protein
MPDAGMIADRYIAAWNERDPGQRRALLTQIWTENGTYADPLMAGKGYDQIDALIAAVHQRFPGFRFVRSGKVDGYGDYVRFSWKLGSEDGDSLVEGTDFAELDGDRFKAVNGFLDRVPNGGG